MRILLDFGYPGKFGSYPLMPDVHSVEEVLVSAAATVFNIDGDAWPRASRLRWESASRTDRGVGALSNAAAFSVQGKPEHAATAVAGISNLTMKDEVFVRRFALVDDNFSPRKQAQSRKYRYFLPPGLIGNDEKAKEALELFRGRHDFSVFSKRDKSRSVDTHCTIHHIDLIPWGEGYILTVAGDRFLWNMIRKITRAVIDLSRGKINTASISEALSHQGTYRPGTQAAAGLYLWKINFNSEIEKLFKEVKIKRNMKSTAYLDRAWAGVLENMGRFKLP